MRRHAFRVWFNTPGDGGGGGNPPAPPAPAPTPTPTPAPTPSPTPTPTPTPAPAKFEYTEDRSKWVPPDTLEARAREAQQYRNDATRFRKMLEAGTGINIGERQEPEDPAIVEARELLLTKILPPEMRKALEFLTSNQDVLSKLSERGTDLLSSTDAQWEERGAKAIGSIHEAVAKDMGVKELTPFQKTALGNSFINWIQQDGQLIGRYSRGDTKVIDEFLTEYRTGFIEPLRRTQQAPNADGARRAARLPPSPTPSGVVPSGAAPPAKPTEDEVHNAAWDTFSRAVGGGARG